MKHEQGQQLRVKTHIRDYWNSFSFVGLVVAALFFAASVTPSLLPRTYYAQCILSGFAIAVGYSLGVASVLLYQFLELPNPSDWLERISKVLASVGVAAGFDSRIDGNACVGNDLPLPNRIDCNGFRSSIDRRNSVVHSSMRNGLGMATLYRSTASFDCPEYHTDSKRLHSIRK